MAQSWHRVGAVSLLFAATEPIELAAGGGLGCPEGAYREDDGNEQA